MWGKLINSLAAGFLTRELGITKATNDARIYDVAVVGGGPAGLSCAACATCEDLATVVIDRNVVGYPLALAHEVIGIVPSSFLHRLQLQYGKTVSARTVVVATGAQYRGLDLPNYKRFEYQSIHYSATGMEAALCVEEEVVIVGSGDSAGQAAVFLGGIARHVHMLISGENLKTSVHSYLVERIHHSPHITVHRFTEVVELSGRVGLEQVTWRNTVTGLVESCNVCNMFVMIGANPNSRWLRSRVALDERGFVQTSFSAGGNGYRFHTSCPGVFAVGDVRAGSSKRVAAAIGEGSAVVADLQRYLGRPNNKDI